MPGQDQTGGYENIYHSLAERLKTADLYGNSVHLGLPCSNDGDVELLFLNRKFIVNSEGVYPRDGKKVKIVLRSVLAGYLLAGSRAEPAGEFVPLSSLAGPVPGGMVYQNDAIERPIEKKYGGNLDGLIKRAYNLGGRLEGEAGINGISIIFNALSKIPLQLIFYDGDVEFPARARLLFDKNAVKFLEFEFLAVLASVFVGELTREKE